MKQSVCHDRLKSFVYEIYELQKPFYLKQFLLFKNQSSRDLKRVQIDQWKKASDCKIEDIVEVQDGVLQNNLPLVFTDNYSPLEQFVFKFSLYKVIVDCIVKGLLDFEYYFVYTCLSMLSNFTLPLSVRVGVSLGQLDFIKTNLQSNTQERHVYRHVYGDLIYKKMGLLIFNDLLRDKVFVIVENYIDFELVLETIRIKNEIKKIK